MKTRFKSAAKAAAALSGDPKMEKRVNDNIAKAVGESNIRFNSYTKTQRRAFAAEARRFSKDFLRLLLQKRSGVVTLWTPCQGVTIEMPVECLVEIRDGLNTLIALKQKDGVLPKP
jgi:hypothetical protein